jgi:maleate isomerase
MTDRLSPRGRIGILVPSFNTSVQPEMEAMRPPGVTNHVARIAMPDGDLSNDADQAAVIRDVGPDLPVAIARVMGARPAAVVVGISIPTFWDGLAGLDAMRATLAAAAGVPVVLGADAVLAALATLRRPGRLGILTPYQPLGDARVRAFLEEAGHEVLAVRSLLRPKGSAIASAEASAMEETLAGLAADGAETLLQIGTNLACADLVEGLSARLGRPVISINTAMYWQALRRAGIADRIPGFGPPLSTH